MRIRKPAKKCDLLYLLLFLNTNWLLLLKNVLLDSWADVELLKIISLEVPDCEMVLVHGLDTQEELRQVVEHPPGEGVVVFSYNNKQPPEVSSLPLVGGGEVIEGKGHKIIMRKNGK